ncbi:MAG TPA: hypothetical protein VJR29_05265 [bacterium]|nr:hypothetical protein [bacterium]
MALLLSCLSACSSHPASPSPPDSAAPPISEQQVEAPAGIFALDGAGGTFRDGNLVDRDFVSGYAWRYGWHLLEPTAGVYAFDPLDHILRAVEEKGQKLAWIIMPTGDSTPAVPDYVLQTSATWTDALGQTQVLPWDPYMLERMGAFLQSAANRPVPGTSTPLRDHPALYAVSVTFPGLPNLAVRDGPRGSIVDIPGFSREAFLDSVVAMLSMAQQAFPRQHHFCGLWKIRDDPEAGELWEELQDRVLAELPSTGFFQDNLAASRPCAGCEPLTGAPHVDFAAPLTRAQGLRYTGLQALTSWVEPFDSTKAEKVAYGTPMDGMAYALESFGTRYFEFYAKDLDQAEWQDQLRAWANSLAGE